MSGSVYIKTLYPYTKYEIFEDSVGIHVSFRRLKQVRLFKKEFRKQERKRRGPYWRYRNRRILTNLDFSRRYFCGRRIR